MRDSKTRDNSLTAPPPPRNIFNPTHSAPPYLKGKSAAAADTKFCAAAAIDDVDAIFQHFSLPLSLSLLFFRGISSLRTLFNWPNKCHWRPWEDSGLRDLKSWLGSVLVLWDQDIYTLLSRKKVWEVTTVPAAAGTQFFCTAQYSRIQ